MNPFHHEMTSQGTLRLARECEEAAVELLLERFASEVWPAADTAALWSAASHALVGYSQALSHFGFGSVAFDGLCLARVASGRILASRSA